MFNFVFSKNYIENKYATFYYNPPTGPIRIGDYFKLMTKLHFNDLCPKMIQDIENKTFDSEKNVYKVVEYYETKCK